VKKIKDSDLHTNKPRHRQLEDFFKIRTIDPVCQDEYVKIPIDLPWEELAQDVEPAFNKFGWHGMIHRSDTDWNRSSSYGGLGLTYNPDYLFNIPKHAQGWGQPRATDNAMNSEMWLNALDSYDYSKLKNTLPAFNTYDDPLGLRKLTPMCEFGSFPSIFDKIKMPLFQGRMAQLKARDLKNIDPKKMEMVWHTDEPNHLIARLFIPLISDENYFIEFKESGQKMYFEPGYAYHWDTYKVHRFNFTWNSNMVNRTALIIGWSPYLEFDGEYWTVNEYVNKVHPKDMIINRMVI
jgi:hypothetical protein